MSDLKETTKDLAGKLISVLPARNRDVITRRFGLKSGEKETLESIGRSYDITRERVRQIEEVSLKQLRGELAAGAVAKLKPLAALAENVLERAGGVLPEEEFFQQFYGAAAQRGNATAVANATLTFLLALDGRLLRLPEDENFNAHWALSEAQAADFKTGVAALTKALAKQATPIAEATLASWSKQAGLPPKAATPALFNTYLAVAKQLARGMFGQIGLTSWPEIKPRGVRDKSYLVLKQVGQPKHFRAITQLINQTFSDRKANTQTVHNELIKDARFVLVGRGLYGLAEWGYKAGTVKDVLVDVLKHARQPLKREDIVAQVLSHRLVKENTILLNLQDSTVFKKTDSGYTLREA